MNIADQIKALGVKEPSNPDARLWNIALDRAADIAAAGEAALRAELLEKFRAMTEQCAGLIQGWEQRARKAEAENDALRADRDRLAADLDVAREALEFYADAGAYEMRYVTRDCGCCTDDYIPAIQDGGDRARAALARITGGDNG